MGLLSGILPEGGLLGQFLPKGGMFGSSGTNKSSIRSIGDIFGQQNNSMSNPMSTSVDEYNTDLPETTPKKVEEPMQAFDGSGLSQQFPKAWKVAQALGKVESSGRYSAIGPTIKGKNAYGKYQIMEQNIPSWSREAGVPATREQFYKNPELQDRVAVYKINALLEQGYSPQDVASIWLSGKPMQGNKRKDLATGVSVPQYVSNFNQHYYGT